ncbi:unnamed protein product [Rotaria socialis]|uniref:DDE-1 domain-containing protein n=1 Tax=Rotaria socialis TaxID=392032 RepID=A0A820KAW7_9BILA|nr:unnamed protein product [Rotaria socialis]
MTPSSVKAIAKNYMIELGRKISIDATLKEWLYGFMNRWNNELKLAKDVKLEKKRSEFTDTTPQYTKWSDHLKHVLEKNQLVNRPDAIWNVDESGFTDDPGRKQVIVKRSTKYSTSSHSGTGKTHATVLMCTSASGECLPPYIIHKEVHLYDTWCPKNGFSGTRYNISSTGWAEEPIFYDWLSYHFLPSVEFIKLAMTNGVQLECLPTHSTTILQPLDAVTLTKLKTAWRKLLHQHNFKTNSAPIDKVKFAYLIKDLWQNNLLKSHCQGGFAKADIYPFDPRAVSKEKLLSPPSSIGVHDNQVSLPTVRSDSNGNMVHRNRSTNTSRTINRSSSCINLSTLSLDLTMTTLEFLTGSNSKNSHSIPQTNEALLHHFSSCLTTASSNSASTIIDTSTNSVNDITSHNSSTNTSNTLNALTKAINNHMTSSQQIANKRKRAVERPYGESLTNMDVLLKLNEKDNKKKSKSANETKVSAGFIT